jgi:hypothetical protein
MSNVRPMHKTLTLRTNGIFIVLWALLVVACFTIGQSPAMPVVLAATLVGLGVGVFQSLAMRSSPPAFLVAKTSSDVKRAFVASTFGRLSIAALWLAVPAMLWLVWFRAELASLQTIVGCYASLLLSRELASLPGVLFLARIHNVPHQT